MAKKTLKKLMQAAIALSVATAVFMSPMPYAGAVKAYGQEMHSYSAYDATMAQAYGDTNQPWRAGAVWEEDDLEFELYELMYYIDDWHNFYAWVHESQNAASATGIRFYPTSALGGDYPDVTPEEWDKQISFLVSTHTLALEFTSPVAGTLELDFASTHSWMVTHEVSHNVRIMINGEQALPASGSYTFEPGYQDLAEGAVFPGSTLPLGEVGQGDKILFLVSGGQAWNHVLTFNDLTANIYTGGAAGADDTAGVETETGQSEDANVIVGPEDTQEAPASADEDEAISGDVTEAMPPVAEPEAAPPVNPNTGEPLDAVIIASGLLFISLLAMIAVRKKQKTQ